MKLEKKLRMVIHYIENILRELLYDPSAILYMLDNLKKMYNIVGDEAMSYIDELLDIADNDNIRRVLVVKIFSTLLDLLIHRVAMKYLDLNNEELSRINIELKYLRALVTLRVVERRLSR